MPENDPVTATANGDGAIAGGAPDPEVQALHRTFKALEADILLARSIFLRQAGVSFGGARDEYEIFGYDRAITVGQYREEYARGGLAGRIVDVMPDATWRGMPAFEIIEKEEQEDYTPFEQAWVDLEQRHQVTSKLQRIDKLARLSTFAVLLIGAPGRMEDELPRSNANGGKAGLLYLRAASGGGGPEWMSQARTSTINDIGDCVIKEYDTDPQSERYGLPQTYTLRTTADLAKTPTRRDVHWSRVVHVAEGLLDNEVFGLPALERVWNLLADLRKVTGGGAEAHFLRANQGLHMDVDKDMEQRGPNGESDLAVVIASLKEQAEAYKHQMTRWIRTKGVKVKTLGSDVSDFGGNADAIITQIAGARGIPKRILTGSEMGELASSQDRENFRDLIVGRQAQYAGPYIVRPLVDRLIVYGYLPTPAKGPQFYDVKWPHIQVLTEQEKGEGASKWMATNQAAKNAGLQPVFTEAETRDKWYGMAPMTDEQKAEIEDAKRAAMELAQEMAPEPAAEEKPAAGRFPRAAEGAEDAELVRVLAEAIEAGNAEVVNRIVGLQDGPHKYGTTQVQLPDDIARKLSAISIDDDDLYEPEGGRETDAHITVCYGLTEAVDVGKMRAALGSRPYVGVVTLGRTDIFQAPDYDVVYVTAQSQDLVKLNGDIRKNLNVKPSGHPDYVPHATVAYVKAGRGDKYAGLTDLEGALFKFDALVMVGKDGERTEVRLA